MECVVSFSGLATRLFDFFPNIGQQGSSGSGYGMTPGYGGMMPGYGGGYGGMMPGYGGMMPG